MVLAAVVQKLVCFTAFFYVIMHCSSPQHCMMTQRTAVKQAIHVKSQIADKSLHSRPWLFKRWIALSTG